MRQLSRLGAFAAVFILGSWTPGLARDPSQQVASYKPLRTVEKPAQFQLSPFAPSGHVVVKFREGTPVASGKLRLGGPAARRSLQIFRDHNLPDPEPSLPDNPTVIQAHRMEAEDRIRTNLPDLSLYFRCPIDDPALATAVIRELNALDEVEIAYFQPTPEVATFENALTTPNFEGGQTYLDPAPSGVHARAAWILPGGDGAGIRITDVEYGWQLTHEDLSKGATAVVIAGNSADNNHGTAVLGEMVADRNNFGMTGIAHHADIGVSTVAAQSVEGAIYSATAISQPGDLILIELHAPGPHYNYAVHTDQSGYVAMEFFQAVFDAIVYASAQGVIVCEAAGNGGENFDDQAIYGQLFQRSFRTSHAIICGAGSPPYQGYADRYKLGFSNYGSRVDLQGYGVLVYTTGYADLYNGGSRDSWYTSGFSGTSSASPIVTGAVASVSGVFKNMFGVIIDADSIRSLLVATGTPQPVPNQAYHIGPRPDLHAALGTLFTPVDSVWYGDIALSRGERAALPVYLSNSHPIQQIDLPFKLSGSTTVYLDSVTRGPRTSGFESLQLVYDNGYFGSIGYLLRSDAGSGAPPLPSGTGIVAYLWVRVPSSAAQGQTLVVDTAFLGSAVRLRLYSYFQDGSPNFFDPGSITVKVCDCSMHGDITGDHVINVYDILALINIAFAGAPPAPTDPTCPHATRADFNCDRVINIYDVLHAIGGVFSNGAPPCDPCQ